MLQVIQKCKKSDLLAFFVIYMLFLLDNILLTVVVPIIPDYLFGDNSNYTVSEPVHHSSIIFDSYKERYYDNGPLGTLFAVKAFVQLLFTPVLGYFISRIPYNRSLLFGSCSMFLSAITFALGKSYSVFLFARGVHGISSSVISVSGMSTLATIVPKEYRAQVMPLAFGGIAFGVLLGYPLGGAFYQLLGKSSPFILIAILILFIIVLQITVINDIQIANSPKKRMPTENISLFKDRHIMILGVTICICTSSLAVLEACVPAWLLVHIKPKPTKWQLGAVFIPDSLGYLIGSHFGGLLPAEQWRTSFASMVIVGVSCCLLPLANSVRQLSLPHFGLGLGVGSVDACLVPLLANFVDMQGGTHYGPIYAFQQLFVALAYSFGPFLGGQAVKLFGFPWLIRIVGFLNLLFGLLLVDFENNKFRSDTKLFIYEDLHSRLNERTSINNN